MVLQRQQDTGNYFIKIQFQDLPPPTCTVSSNWANILIYFMEDNNLSIFKWDHMR